LLPRALTRAGTEQNMRRSTERILTTHTGSLPRTPRVLGMLQATLDGQPPERAVFDEVVRDGVGDVVAQQVEAGLDVVNDGEMSKFSFANYNIERLEGFTVMELAAGEGRAHTMGREAEDYPEYFERWAFNPGAEAAQGATSSPVGPVCAGPVSYKDVAAVQRDIANVLDAAQSAGATEAFMSAVPPTGVAGGFEANQYYSSEDEFYTAMAEAMRVEYEAIVNAGIVLQLDCNWGVFSRIGSDSLGEVRRTIGRNIEVINHATRNIDPDSMRIHLCWGADEAPHHRDLPLSDIIDLMLTARPNGLGVVASNGRHVWEWRVWKDVKVPDGKVIIPGVIDSTTNIIEHPESVAERITRFADVLGRENMIAGVDCGFDTIAGSAQVLPRIAWAKLRSLGEGARLASAALY
jgi:5-methyltetrahydropteroyltriglutamate--homocysteine methyltransferase